MSSKPTNPKDSHGVLKASLSVVPFRAIYEMALAFVQGGLKYGRHNYRVKGVRSSVYYDAAMRHIVRWWEGEDIDPDSDVHNLAHAMACLAILRDAEQLGKLNDDRPPKLEDGWMDEINKEVKRLVEMYPQPVKPYTEVVGKDKWFSMPKPVTYAVYDDATLSPGKGFYYQKDDFVYYSED